jgi:hypothetical protein
LLRRGRENDRSTPSSSSRLSNAAALVALPLSAWRISGGWWHWWLPSYSNGVIHVFLARELTPLENLGAALDAILASGDDYLDGKSLAGHAAGDRTLAGLAPPRPASARRWFLIESLKQLAEFRPPPPGRGKRRAGDAARRSPGPAVRH